MFTDLNSFFAKKLQKAKKPRYMFIQLDINNLATTTKPELALSKHRQP